MQLRARAKTTTANSSTAETIKSETTMKMRSPRAKRLSQALNGVTMKTEPSVAPATVLLRSTKRRAVTLAYDNDDAVKIELKQDELGSVTAVDSPVADAAKKTKKKRVSKTQEMRVKREQPAQWEAMLSGIQAMRAKRKAEVDTMGCEVRF